MKKSTSQVIGVMSGTSLDGIDIVFIEFQHDDARWTFDMLNAQTIPYSKYWRKELREAMGYSEQKWERLNYKYADKLAEEIGGFIRRNGIQTLDAVCSHGHTIMHRPEKGWTYQIGNLPRLAKDLERTLVCDFRVQDVALGGQGAPLVPIGDRMLFSEYDYCLNLGGFSNISFEEKGERIAYDISPVNTVLNYYAHKLGMEYDNKGNISKSGIFNHELFEKLNSLDFYHKKHPKSLGFEFVKEVIFPITENYEITEVLRTFTEHIAFQISKNSKHKNSKLLITGGGTYNEFLIEQIQHYLPEKKIVIPEKKIIEYKEALIFALLGYLKLQNRINVLSSVTGATQNHSSGVVYEK